jgi:hypothetical protein
MVEQDKYVMLQNMELFLVMLKVSIEYVQITNEEKKMIK